VMNLEDIRGRATISLWPEAGQLLGLSRNTAYGAAREGSIPTLRFGSVIRVPVPALLVLLGEHQTAPDMSEAGPASPAVATTTDAEKERRHDECARPHLHTA